MIEPSFIKKYIEKQTGFDDIGTVSRNRKIVFCRYIAFKLCKDFSHALSLESIGKTFGRDHSTVLVGLKEFNNLYNQSIFKDFKKLYIESYKFIENVYNKENSFHIIFNSGIVEKIVDLPFDDLSELELIINKFIQSKDEKNIQLDTGSFTQITAKT